MKWQMSDWTNAEWILGLCREMSVHKLEMWFGDYKGFLRLLLPACVGPTINSKNPVLANGPTASHHVLVSLHILYIDLHRPVYSPGPEATVYSSYFTGSFLEHMHSNNMFFDHLVLHPSLDFSLRSNNRLGFPSCILIIQSARLF